MKNITPPEIRPIKSLKRRRHRHQGDYDLRSKKKKKGFNFQWPRFRNTVCYPSILLTFPGDSLMNVCETCGHLLWAMSRISSGWIPFSISNFPWTWGERGPDERRFRTVSDPWLQVLSNLSSVGSHSSLVGQQSLIPLAFPHADSAGHQRARRERHRVPHLKLLYTIMIFTTKP